MARKARQLEAFGVYVVHQTASEDSMLFKNDRDRERFLLILKQTKSRYGYQLFSYCINESSAYDLVIGTNGSDLSKVMKSINIAYALYASKGGKLFKDRYKSERLESDEAVMAMVQSFKEKQAQDQANRSFRVFEGDINLLDTFMPCDLVKGKNCSPCIVSLEEAKTVLSGIASSAKQDIDSLMRDKERRDKLILKFRRESTLSLKELGLLFGGLSESTVCKILKEQCQ